MQELYQGHPSRYVPRFRSLNIHVRICCRSLQSTQELQCICMSGKTRDRSEGTERSRHVVRVIQPTSTTLLAL